MGTSASRLRRYAIFFLLWTVFGVFFFTQDLARSVLWHDPTPWWRYLASWLIGVWASASLTPGILWLGDRFPIERRNWPSRAALHVLFSVGFAIAEIAIVSLVFPRLGFLGPLEVTSSWASLPAIVVLSFHGNLVAYWTIWGIQQTFRHYRRSQEREKDALRLELRAAELESLLASAKLGALKMQLQPHFLFNTLNAIMVLVRQHKRRQAEETLGRLGDLLRFVLDDVDAQEVPLRRELEYLELYLSIEQVRYQDRLHITIDAAPELLDAAVPHMGLQPIVENAVRHGIGQSLTAEQIIVRAERAGDTLVLRVIDDGPGLETSAEPGTGIGLANTRARLAQLYGAAASLDLANGEPRGVVATITLPYRVAEAVAQPTEREERHAAHHVNRRR